MLFHMHNSADTAPCNNFPYFCKPDCSVYNHNHLPQEGETLDSSLIEFTIKFKTRPSQDPFRHGLDCNADTDKNNPLMVTESTGSKTAGQVIAYTTLILSTQYRTHTFSVLIIKDYAQLICWDRSGAIVTEPIYYNDQSYLFDFLVRYDHASNEAYGHDPTVGPPANHEAQAARTIKELSEANSLLSVTIQGSQPQGSHRFIISTPCGQPDIPAGRWT